MTTKERMTARMRHDRKRLGRLEAWTSWGIWRDVGSFGSRSLRLNVMRRSTKYPHGARELLQSQGTMRYASEAQSRCVYNSAVCEILFVSGRPDPRHSCIHRKP